MARPPHMRRSRSLTVLLFSLTAALIVVAMGGPTPPQGPPSIPKKPGAVVFAEVPPGPQGPEKPPKKPNAVVLAEGEPGHGGPPEIPK